MQLYDIVFAIEYLVLVVKLNAVPVIDQPDRNTKMGCDDPISFIGRYALL
jgi:hypothetical protein